MRLFAYALYDKAWGIVFIGRVGFLLLRGQYKAAESLCRKGIHKLPRDPVYHEWLAKTLWKENRLDEAIQEYRVAIGLRRHAFSADRIDLVRLLLQAKRYEETLVECKRLLDPQFHRVSGVFKALHEYTAYDSMYRVYSGLGDYQKAKEALVQLLRFQKGRARTQIIKKIQEIERFQENQGQP